MMKSMKVLKFSVKTCLNRYVTLESMVLRNIVRNIIDINDDNDHGDDSWSAGWSVVWFPNTESMRHTAE